MKVVLEDIREKGTGTGEGGKPIAEGTAHVEVVGDSVVVNKLLEFIRPHFDWY